MTKSNLIFFLVFILILSGSACSSQEESPGSTQKEVAQEIAARKDTTSGGTTEVEIQGTGAINKTKRPLRQPGRLEENKKLFEIANSGENEETTYIRLTPENEYTDTLAEGYSFTREETSGPGTGKFTGEGFEFAEGACEDLDNLSDTDKKRVRWKKRINKCQALILENDWCARRIDDPTETYNLTFLSWSISNEECMGVCEENDFKTAYIRVKTEKE